MHYKSICTINLYGYLFQHLFHKRMVYLEIIPYGIIPPIPSKWRTKQLHSVEYASSRCADGTFMGRNMDQYGECPIN